MASTAKKLKKTPTLIIETIQREVFQGRQSWNLKHVLRFRSHQLLVEVKRDSYDFQSYARIKLFDGYKWNLLANIPYANMKSLSVSYVQKQETVEPCLQADADELLRIATDLLRGGKPGLT